MSINDLPKQLYMALRTQGKDISDSDPIRLVVEDVVFPTNICHQWAIDNHLVWNPAKSQIVEVHQDTEGRESVHQGVVDLRRAEEVEYLGLCFTKDGFMGKTQYKWNRRA